MKMQSTVKKCGFNIKMLKHDTYRINLLAFLLVLAGSVHATSIPSDSVIANNELKNYLKPLSKTNVELEDISLAEYFRNVFSKRYFCDWKQNPTRIAEYKSQYGGASKHEGRAKDHMDKYPAKVQWQLPFNYQNGQPVNAYALRHLARQHKMIDIAMLQKLTDNDNDYIKYFTVQMQSLNAALVNEKYETIKSGNGVYEAFRIGYRVLNWVKIHSLFLDESGYTDEDQLRTIATLLQHGQHLYERNQAFRAGNHQTRGMSALAMLSILFQDFEGTDAWYELSMKRLEEHLEKEINDDGFQFERSVHYHMSDINNYYYVYQLAKINNMPISDNWDKRLESLFTTLVKIAYPDKSAPVLQDDTDNPWAEKNDIRGALTLGYLLFENPEYGYFAKHKVTQKMYWFLSQKQLDLLKEIDTKKPKYGSLYFPDTKYYFMREGFDKGDKVMVVSAGLDPDKPDHQHGDMLGIQAMANGEVILPNYQVRYSLPDYGFFKNSMVKNVALVDNELQGKRYKGNKGGSGFGKFKELPNPITTAWEVNDDFDLFVGRHDGFENVGVNYTRQVIYVKDQFWIVKDNFTSEATHTYKQVWQGHYTPEGRGDLLQASWDDATGCDIYQLNAIDSVHHNGAHGKQWNVVTKDGEKDFDFITVIYPYRGYNKGINTSKKKVGDWKVNELNFDVKGDNIKSLSKSNEAYLFGVNAMKVENSEIQFDFPIDCYISFTENKITISSLGTETNTISINNKRIKLLPGKYLSIDIK